MSLENITGRRLAGRCANGCERDAGSIAHAVPAGTSHETALCGAEPGRRSVGWSDQSQAIDCPRCIRAVSRLILNPGARARQDRRARCQAPGEAHRGLAPAPRPARLNA